MTKQPPPRSTDPEHDQTAIDAICACAGWCDRDVLSATLALACEIAWHGGEEGRIGTLFTIGRSDDVLAVSRALILDPLAGHSPASTDITDERLRGTVKELAQLDGAFVLRDDGVVVSACRYLDVSAGGVELPMGLGSRHLAAASISKQLGIIAIAVSQNGTIRVFCDGAIVATFARSPKTGGEPGRCP